MSKSLTVGTPLSIVTGFATFKLAMKYAVPLEVAGAAVGLVVQGIGSLLQYFARGGRKGEAD